MVKVTIEEDGKVEAFEGDCFCGFLLNYEDNKTNVYEIARGYINYPNATQAILNLWKTILKARSNGDKDIQEMRRQGLILRLRTLDLD